MSKPPGSPLIEPKTPMSRAFYDALVLGLENDAQCEHILRLALPFFQREHDREVTRLNDLVLELTEANFRKSDRS